MMRKKKETTKERWKQLIKRAAVYLTAAFFCAAHVSVNVYATAKVTRGITTIKTLATSIVTGIGGIVVVWGVFDLGSAYLSNDAARQTDGIRKIVGGIIMAVASQLVALLIK